MDYFEKSYNVALRFLSYRPRSEKEVRDYLKIKNRLLETSGLDIKSVIDKVIQKLKEQKLLNDEEFTKWWIDQRTTFKPRGLRLIKLELRQKGIPDETIEDQIAKMKNEIDSDLEQAKELVRKRIKRFRNPSTPLGAGKFGMTRDAMYQKLGSYLARRGFDWETIKQSIDEVLEKKV